MSEMNTWLQAAAGCGECGQPVFFDQRNNPPTFMSVCSDDPEHAIGPAAQQALDQVRRDKPGTPRPRRAGPKLNRARPVDPPDIPGVPDRYPHQASRPFGSDPAQRGGPSLPHATAYRHLARLRPVTKPPTTRPADTPAHPLTMLTDVPKTQEH
jgi:hypothetical protein